jgi:hypothetical protein
MGIANPEKRARMIARLTDDLDSTQIRDALNRVMQSRIPNRKEVMAQLFARWGELEPIAAIEFSKTLPRSSDKHDALIAILNGWMEIAPDAAEKWVAEQPEGNLKGTAWETIIAAYAADNPRKALALAQSTKLPWRNLQGLAEPIFGAWAVRDPTGAAAETTKLPQDFLRMEAQCIIAKQWAETDPNRAIEWAESLPDLLLSHEWEGFGGMVTTVGADRSNTMKRIVDTWLKRDADAAVGWLRQLPDDPWKMLMIANACSQNVETTHDPGIALQLANLFPEGGKRDEALQFTGQRLSEIHPENVPGLLSLEMDSRTRAAVMTGIAESLEGESLLAALRKTDGASLAQITQWADPKTAVDWASQQPDNETYMPRIAGAWLAKDPDASWEFVMSLPATVRDGALSGAIETSLYRGPESSEEMAKKWTRAGEWIAKIEDPRRRQMTYRSLAERWLHVEPVSARQWIDSIPISAELKSELLKNPPNTK